MASKTELTYIMIKPDGVQRGLVGEIIGRFEKRGYQLMGTSQSVFFFSHLVSRLSLPTAANKFYLYNILSPLSGGSSSRLLSE